MADALQALDADVAHGEGRHGPGQLRGEGQGNQDGRGTQVQAMS
jgi:hypothetical protein